MKRIFSILFALVLVLSFSLVMATPVGATTHYVNPGESIQAAINAASDGDTIIVAKGTYQENVVVWKDVTVKSAKKHEAVVVGQPVGCVSWAWDVFRVIADGATVEGFDVRMYGPGPVADGHDGIGVKASGVTVRDNRVEGPGHFTGIVPKTGWGISVIPDDAAPGGTWCGDTVWNKGEVCSECIIEGNEIRGTTRGGIWVTGIDCLIRKNKVEGTQYTGILLAPMSGWVGTDPYTWGTKYSHGNLIAENKVKKCGTDWHADDGIRLGYGAYDNVVYDNDVKDSANSGIKAHWNSYDNTIVGNKIKGSGVFDAYDQSTTGTRTAGTKNWWAGNKGKTESPTGLLK